MIRNRVVVRRVFRCVFMSSVPDAPAASDATGSANNFCRLVHVIHDVSRISDVTALSRGAKTCIPVARRRALAPAAFGSGALIASEIRRARIASGAKPPVERFPPSRSSIRYCAEVCVVQ